MRYKSLFLDIDNTLISKHQPVSPSNLAAIRRARDAGIYVTVATGRGYLGSRPIWKDALAIEGYIIVYGGACIMDTRDDTAVFSAEIQPELITEALEAAREWGLFAQIYEDDAVICENESDFATYYTNFQRLPLRIEPAIRQKTWRHVPKVLVISPPEKELEMLERFKERFSGRMEVASSNPGFIELNKHGVHKGTTMLRLASMLGIAQEETAAIGDNTLDLEMIRMAGLGMCVENGQQAVKDCADAIIPACDDDGVAYAINHYLMPE